MQSIRYVLVGILLIGGWIPQALLSKTITLLNSSGESVEFEVDPSDQFLDIVEQIQFYFQTNETHHEENQAQKIESGRDDREPFSHQLNFAMSHAGITIRAKKTNWRDYDAPVTKKEKEKISYIIRTLANDSLISIGSSQSSLKKAGNNIDHLHPFRFLITVFTDEELKAGVHAIRDRGGWIWSGFIEGITGSLDDEGKNNNLIPFTSDFAKEVKINSDLILPSLKQGKWENFINILIDKIPREIDPNRYNM